MLAPPVLSICGSDGHGRDHLEKRESFHLDKFAGPTNHTTRIASRGIRNIPQTPPLQAPPLYVTHDQVYALPSGLVLCLLTVQP